MRSVPRGFVAAALIAVAAASACSGGGDTVVIRPPSHASSSAPTTAASSSAASTPARRPAVTIRPNSGLQDGQSVQVIATGFAANEALTVVECAAKGTNTGPGDCNLAAMQGVSADGAGRVTTTLVVRRGPFGANQIICSASQACLVSVTQASLSPTDEADAPITFAP